MQTCTSSDSSVTAAVLILGVVVAVVVNLSWIACHSNPAAERSGHNQFVSVIIGKGAS